MSDQVETRLDVLWTVTKRPGEVVKLYVHFIPWYDDPGVRHLFQGGAYPLTPLSELDPELPGLADVLMTEVAARAGPSPERTAGSYKLPIKQTQHVSHHATAFWSGGVAPTDVVTWATEDFVGGDNVGQEQRKIAVAELTGAAKAVINKLSAAAIELAYRRHQKKLDELVDLPAAALPPPSKPEVFISYRRANLVLAKGLHGVVAAYGHYSHFKPFLDEHELEAGRLLPQLQERVRRSDVFIPLVTEDYAQPGSISEKELGWACEREKEGHLVIAPLFIGRPKTAVADRLHEFLFWTVDGPGEISEKTLQDCLKTVRATVAKRKGR